MKGFVVVIIGILIFLVYNSWFSFSTTLSSGDWPYLYKENIEDFSFVPERQNLWLAPYYQIPSKILVQYIGLSWELVERIVFFFPLLILSIISSYYLTKSWIGVLVYTTNTYILMVIGGGQVGVALAYSIAPLVLARFIKLIDNVVLLSQNFKLSLWCGLVLAIQAMFDPRIAYITILGIFFYYLLNFRLKTVLYLGIAIAVALLLNLYWIIPFVDNGFPSELLGYSNIVGFQFLSFADFSNAFSLLHPNWPENIFGKTYFMKPEFILIPIIAYFSLLLISKINRTVLFFATLGLVGAFLAKGSKPPFNEINEFLFSNVIGMNMFRDSSKFYILIAMSYAFLIPFSLSKLSAALKVHKIFIAAIFIAGWMIFIRQAILGDLTGTFKASEVPREYIQFKEFLQRQKEGFSILWIPQRQRFGYNSSSYPEVSAKKLFLTSDPKKIIQKIKKDRRSAMQLYNLKIQYVVLPYDSEKELFLNDRVYSETLQKELEKELDTIPWLSKNKNFNKLGVYKLNP